MDKERRSRLKSVVGRARRVVEDDVRVQLRRLGIDENEIKPVQNLLYLSAEDKELRTRIIEAIEKEKAGDISYDEAFDRYVRHVGFTYVNRIAALRAMEVRGLIKETVTRRDVYGGRSRREYELAERERISDPYELLKAGLVEAFKEVSAEIRVLFDVNSEYSLVFLGHKALLELIRLLSEEVPEEDWKEDDVTGWIYQYYNEEARAEFKKAKLKPKADDIPVINQFYTPRWVVRVLVDNTLGRLWLEMNGRCPKRGDTIKKTIEQLETPSGDAVDEFCSYLIPLSQEPLTRKKKSVREIKILDPACGSGHFLVYAFDVLLRMYREDEPDIPVEDIPMLILENNLFGIDIDLRAIQLAALSLYLKAKSYNPRLKITKMNLVCADARITDGRVRKVFLERFADDPELQMIFAKIFEDLEYTYEIGSLLKARKPFEKLLERRRQEKGAQAILVPKIEGQTFISKGGKIEGQTRLDLEISENKESSKVIAVPTEITLEQMLGALRKFETEAMERRDMGTLLFATEAEKSVGLLGLLAENYDTVLMNPPYGDVPARTKEYLRKHYPRTHFDYYASFIEQAITLCSLSGYVGMLTSSTFLLLRSFAKLREEILWSDAVPELLADLGANVLDVAWAEWAATVLLKRDNSECKSEEHECTFLRLKKFKDEQSKRSAFERILTAKDLERIVYVISLGELKKIPRTRYAYWAPKTIRNLFAKYPPFDRDVVGSPRKAKIADVKVGLQTGDDGRFLRFFWEVLPENIGTGKHDTVLKRKWVPFSRGTWLTPFYESMALLVDWNKNGEEIKNFKDVKGKLLSRPQNESFYFREGLTWMTSPQMGTIIKGTLRRINMRRMPSGCIFAVNNSALFPVKDWLWETLALLNSSLAYYLLRLMVPRTLDVGTIAALPFPNDANLSKLALYAKECYEILREWDTGNETSIFFIEPWILQNVNSALFSKKPQTKHPLASEFRWVKWDSLTQIQSTRISKDMPLRKLAELSIEREKHIARRVAGLLEKIDSEVYRVYDVSETDKESVEDELGISKNETFISNIESIQEHVHRLVSFYIRNLIESSTDGIVPLSELIQGIRKNLADDFGEDQIDQKEREIEEVLGEKLEDWIASGYFGFHLDLYKLRPILWHMTSADFSTIRGSKGILNIFLHYHKLDRDTIPKILTKYVKPELDAIIWKADRLKRELKETRDKGNKTKERELEKQAEASLAMLEELQNFQRTLETVHNPRLDKTKLPKNLTWLIQKIAEVRDNGYDPVIDYGVRVNIEPLKEAGLLHKAAERVK